MKTKIIMSGLLILGSILQAATLPVTSGLVMHLDAGTLSTGPVGVWADQSGLTGNDGVQPDANWQPVCVAAAPSFNNRPVVRFDGVNDFLDLNGNMVNVGSFTMFVAAQFDRTGMTGNSYICAGQHVGNDRLRIAWDLGKFHMRAGNSVNLPGWNAPANTKAHIFVMTSQVSGYLDGTYLGTSTNTATLNPEALNLGSYGGNVVARKEHFKGDMAEVIFYNRVLTATEMEQVGVYLSNKYPTFGTAYKNLVHDPSPANAAIGVLPEAAVTWKAGLDPADLTKVNPAIKKYYVWMTNGNPTDPNLAVVATIDIANYADITADGVYVPTPNLGYDKTYSWKVEEGLDNGQGGAYSAGDPNNLTGPVWTFQTAGTVPSITVQPASVKVDAGQTVVFTIGYASVSSPSVIWYKDGAPLAAGGDITIDSGNDSSTLSIANADSGNEGGYYAVVTNSGGSSDPTATAYLRLNQRLAWYRFEQNLDDSEGGNHGSSLYGMQYAAGPVVADGQAYAADPNGTNYALLTNDAFPKAGFGNGLDVFTYGCWVKLDAGQGGAILGDLIVGANTGIRFSVNGVENDISLYLRQQGGQAVTAGTSPLSRDGQWHHVAATYNASQVKIYVDGVLKSTSGINTLTNFVPWEFPMVVMAINGRGSVEQRFSGQIDDLQILNYALTSEQVAQTYLSVKGGWVCDSQQPALLYDYDNNCQVDIGDLAIFAAKWLESNRIYAQ